MGNVTAGRERVSGKRAGMMARLDLSTLANLCLAKVTMVASAVSLGRKRGRRVTSLSDSSTDPGKGVEKFLGRSIHHRSKQC